MSPLDPNHAVFETAVVANGEVIDIETVRPKIIYAMDELMKLRYVLNKPLKVTENPQLRLVARVNLMPAFAAMTMIPQRPANGERTNYFMGPRRGPNPQFSKSMTFQRRENLNHTNARIQISLPQVKLNEAEHAWKPTHLKAVAVESESSDSDVLDELRRRVRSILNKLTAQNFDVMLNQFKELNVNTEDKLNVVITLVFEKAVNEPTFSTGYAFLCKHLSDCSSDNESVRKFFKRTLITKCQHEFEQNVADTKSIEKGLQPLKNKLKECALTDVERINEVKASIVEEESNMRRRLVSTVRFIGELYKMDMLTTNIMNWCIKCLVDSGAEDKLECLSKLLTTIGQKLETKPADKTDREMKRYLDLTEYFKQLKKIVDRKVPKLNVSSRYRFMLMDLIDLRKNNWKPKIGTNGMANTK